MNRNDRLIAAALILAMAASAAAVAAYAVAQPRWMGAFFALAAACFAAAACGWAFWILPRAEVVDERDDYPSQRGDRILQSIETQESVDRVTRRTVLVRLLYGAAGVFALAVIAPLRSLGRGGVDALFHTKWRRGSRLVREDGRPVHRNELNVDSVVTVFPEDAVGDAASQTVLIRVPADAGAATDGYMAYSKVCTHAGCAIALYRAQAKQLMCPCHQSVFNVLADGAVVSGPADRPLPRLPIAFDAHGFAIAEGDFPGPVGPGFWEAG